MTNKTEWVQVGELAEGFAPDSNKLDIVDDLAGKTLDLHLKDGAIIRHNFESGTRLIWEVLEGDDKGNTGTEQYTATSIREGIYFVDFLKAQEEATSVNLVMNLETGKVIGVIAKLPSEQQTMRAAFERVIAADLLTGVDATFIHAAINREFAQSDEYKETDELIGKRVQYTYSPHEVYEHIYLNANYYCWQCLKGVEKGLSDTDRCHYYKIADNLYFFVWREKIIPTLGSIMIDLNRLKTTGKILGYDGTDFKKLNNFHVGAFAKPLNETRHTFE